MPPSGYSGVQAEKVCEFLDSCTGALGREAKSFGRSLASQCEREIGDIDGHLQRPDLGELERAVLLLTRAFYRQLSTELCDSVGEEEAVQRAIATVRQTVLAVKIPV